MADEEPQPYSLVSLVMPFVTCATNGGPHEDHAFVQGYVVGYLDALLDLVKPAIEDRYVHPSIVPQVDLLAMRHGYRITTEPWDAHPDEWVRVRLVREDRRASLRP